MNGLAVSGQVSYQSISQHGANVSNNVTRGVSRAPQIRRNGEEVSREDPSLLFVIGAALRLATESVSNVGAVAIESFVHTLDKVKQWGDVVDSAWPSPAVVEGVEQSPPQLSDDELDQFLAIMGKHNFRFPDSQCESLKSGDMLSVGIWHGGNLESVKNKDVLSLNNLDNLAVEINTKTNIYPIFLMEEVGSNPVINNKNRKDILITLKRAKSQNQNTVVGFKVDNKNLEEVVNTYTPLKNKVTHEFKKLRERKGDFSCIKRVWACRSQSRDLSVSF